MKQLEEQKRIHDAETGTLKAKLVEQYARVDELEAEIIKRDNWNSSLQNALDVTNEKFIDLSSENQALKSELEKQEENIATEFEATAYCDDQTNEMFMEYVDGVFDDLDGGETYRVLILQKETE